MGAYFTVTWDILFRRVESLETFKRSVGYVYRLHKTLDFMHGNYTTLAYLVDFIFSSLKSSH